jgi:hypothetical protein
MGRWVGPKVGLDALENRKNFAYYVYKKTEDLRLSIRYGILLSFFDVDLKSLWLKNLSLF